MNDAEKVAFRRFYALRYWERDGGFAGDVTAADIQVILHGGGQDVGGRDWGGGGEGEADKAGGKGTSGAKGGGGRSQQQTPRQWCRARGSVCRQRECIATCVCVCVCVCVGGGMGGGGL